jgi:hypothetical protein
VTFQKRFAKGFQALASYTWSHSIDDGQGSGTNALFYNSPNSYYNGNYAFEKGTGILDQRHRLVYSFIWSPTITHRNDPFFRYVVNNWQLASITTIASGRPTGSATVRTTDTPIAGALSASSLNGFTGSTRAPFLPVDGIYTPASYREDLRITKIIPIAEKLQLYLMGEAFNISNSWSPTSMTTQVYTEKGGVLTLTPGAYGVGTQDGGFPDGTQARRLQASVRLVF